MEVQPKIGTSYFEPQQFAHRPVAKHLNDLGLFLLIALWSYAVISKLGDLALFEKQMLKQPFPEAMNIVLIYAVPFLEMLSIIIIIFGSQKLGLWISILLLSSFTVYVGLSVLGYFAKIPCSCGGLISTMSWKTHFWFNLFFIVINAYCLFYTIKKERRSPGK